MTKRGAFIVLEGIDRSGKTTQSQKLAEFLINSNFKTHVRRIPDRDLPITGKAINEFLQTATDIDQSKKTMHLVFSANRWEMKEDLERLLSEGVNVIADRYVYSGIAYSLAKGLEKDWVVSVDEGLLAPDVIMFFDLSPASAGNRSGYGDEVFEKVEFQQRVYSVMKGLMEQKKDDNVSKIIINAERDIDSIFNDVKTIATQIIEKEKEPFRYFKKSDLI
uniref:dTMP kinase n=1 Tax=Rhabditophanes sp. KR3021 TaxID=114890 RepID=A0AC35TMA1_9BILA